ncbi:MAG: hypothetical protein LAO24_12945 [Acidobacteriia bacterium]|nr:hypothetical protein [Terriglobia bacterium]
MGNRGIIQYGGSIQAGSLAVGDGASAYSQAYKALADKGLDEIKGKLEELVQAVKAESGQLKDAGKVHKSTEELARELAKEKPEKPVVLRILEQIAGAAGNVSTVIAAVKGLIGVASFLV